MQVQEHVPPVARFWFYLFMFWYPVCQKKKKKRKIAHLFHAHIKMENYFEKQHPLNRGLHLSSKQIIKKKKSNGTPFDPNQSEVLLISCALHL